jgi:integrase
MAQKKDVRSDNTYLITEESTANPKLGAKILANGTESLFLDFYYGTTKVYDPDKGRMVEKKSRKREYLKLYLWRAPRTPQERNDNRETLELAKKIRDEREQETKEIIDGYRIRVDDKNLLTYWDSFIENEDVADKRLMKAALNNFRRFLKEEYPMFADRIEPKQLRPDMMQRFVDFLVDNHKGQGVMTYYKRFKRLINYAISRGIIKNNPCKGSDGKPIAPPKTDDILSKDILSADELQQLFNTHYEGQNPEIRRAFALTCYCGIRHCDIVKLTYSDIDYGNKILTFRQSKTAAHSSKSGVTIPLNDTLLAIIGEKPEGAKDDLIFHLPTDTMCLKALRSWTKKAGIDKHITWHCGRHSFATMILTNGANVKVVSELLGHSSLRFTEIYVRAMDEAKKNAINSLPTLKLDNI